MLGYIPAGFAYGVLAGKAGFSGIAALLMSVLVFAGAAQYAAVAMFSAGQSMATIVLTTFIINIRHLLMSAALAPALSKWSSIQRIALALQMTDETFAIHSTAFSAAPAQPGQVFGVNITAHTAWIGGSVLGFVASGLLPDLRVLGFDFALPAMFIALFACQVKGKATIVAGLYAGITAIWLHTGGHPTMAVMAATVVGATTGVFIELWATKQSS